MVCFGLFCFLWLGLSKTVRQNKFCGDPRRKVQFLLREKVPEEDMEQFQRGFVLSEGQSKESSGILKTLGILAASSKVSHRTVLESRFLTAEKAAQSRENHVLPTFSSLGSALQETPERTGVENAARSWAKWMWKCFGVVFQRDQMFAFPVMY